MEKVDIVLNKEEMYKLIWLDYFDRPKSERTECFIYRFLKKNKTRRCQRLSSDIRALTDYGRQKRYDKYTLLKSSRLAYKNNVSDREHYIGVLSDITGGDISSLTGKTDDELDSISVSQEEKLLSGCITDFFQNSGYRFKKKDAAEDTEGDYDKVEVKYTKKQDGYINDLDMWADFYLYEKDKGNTVSGTLDSPAMNDEYIEKCENLYAGLVDEEQADVFVPLCFDVRSGAGIYIIGSERLMGTDIEFDDIPCCVFISNFFYVDCCDYDNEEMLLAMQFRRADSIRDAFDLFRKNGTVFFRHYPTENSAIPESADKCFSIFFDRSAPLRTERLVRKLLEREESDLKKKQKKSAAIRIFDSEGRS